MSDRKRRDPHRDGPGGDGPRDGGPGEPLGDEPLGDGSSGDGPPGDGPPGDAAPGGDRAGGGFVDEEPEPPPTPLDDEPLVAEVPPGAPHDAPAEAPDRRDWSVPVGPTWSEEGAGWEDEEDLLDDAPASPWEDDAPDLLADPDEEPPWDEEGPGGAEDALDEVPVGGGEDDGPEPDEGAWAELEAELPVVGWREAVTVLRPDLRPAPPSATCDPTRPDSWLGLPGEAALGDGARVGEDGRLAATLRVAGHTVEVRLVLRRDDDGPTLVLGRDALAGRFLVDPARDGAR